jgi:hypothetical protein
MLILLPDCERLRINFNGGDKKWILNCGGEISQKVRVWKTMKEIGG